MQTTDPEYFNRLSQGQTPTFLFIGCSDSRVPANTITGTAPGEMFVHRNIANQVFPADLNMLSVVQYAVDVLDVSNIIVVGHSQCGGVKAAMTDTSYGTVDHWLSQLRDIRRTYREQLDAIENEEERIQRLVSLNVVKQIYNLAHIPLLMQAWKRGKRPLLHGLVYELQHGILDPLVVGVDSVDKAEELVDLNRAVLEDPWTTHPSQKPAAP